MHFKERQQCKLFRCLKCWKLILPDEDVSDYADGYIHSVCDPIIFKKKQKEIILKHKIERIRDTRSKQLRQNAIRFKLEAESLARQLEDESPRKPKRKADYKKCSNCNHIRFVHCDYTDRRNGNRVRHCKAFAYDKCDYCECERFVNP
jgi:hypothetical protein